MRHAVKKVLDWQKGQFPPICVLYRTEKVYMRMLELLQEQVGAIEALKFHTHHAAFPNDVW